MDKLLNVSDAPGFHLKGITFDGDGKTHILVQLNGACPGLTLDALRFDGIKTYGLVVADCDGAADRPVVLSNLSFDTTADTQTAVYFFFGGKSAEPKAIVAKDLTFWFPRRPCPVAPIPTCLKQLESVNALLADFGKPKSSEVAPHPSFLSSRPFFLPNRLARLGSANRVRMTERETCFSARLDLRCRMVKTADLPGQPRHDAGRSARAGGHAAVLHASSTATRPAGSTFSARGPKRRWTGPASRSPA